jgi:restriction system protein
MKDSSSVVEGNTPTAPSEISTAPISSEDSTPADYQVFSTPVISTPVIQQKPKFSKIFQKISYFLLGSIFIFLGLGISLEGSILWSLVCFLIAILIFKFEVSKLIAPAKPKFLHLLMYTGYLTVASISLIFGLLIILSSPIAGIFFLLMAITFLNFAFIWKPKEQIVRSEEARKNILAVFLVAGKNILVVFLVIGTKFLKVLKKWLEKRKLEKNRSRDINVILAKIDGMDGYEFERFLKPVFERLGYSVIHTPLSGDQGADLILSRDRGRIAVQVKRYSSKVSNKAVQEVVASKALYKCTEGLVVTNNYFTNSAIELAKANGIGLIDRDELKRIITKSYN